MKKIVIIGNFGATNIGDEAILESILTHHKGKASFTVFSYNPKETELNYKVHTAYPFPFGLRSLLKFRFLSTLKAVYNSDGVIFGGGGLIFDTKLYAIFLWSWQIFWCVFLRKPIFIYAVGIGPLNRAVGKLLAKWIFKKAKFITVRDRDSYKLIEQLGISEQKIRTTSDPTLLLKIEPKKDKKIDFRTKNLFIISLRNWSGINTKKIADILLEIKGGKIFVPMQTKHKEKDNLIAACPARDCKLQPARPGIANCKDWKELIKILQKGNISIGMRLHFCIFSTMLYIPTIALSYSPKVKTYMESIKQGNLCINLKDFNNKILKEKINYVFKNYNKIQMSLQKNIAVQKKKAKENVELLDRFIQKLKDR